MTLQKSSSIRPLSEHARAELKDIRDKPVPRNGVNPGVAARLERDALVDCVMLPSPFKTHKGALIQHLQITEAGRAVVAY